MESKIEHDVKITLNLNWHEALWLKTLVQNPLYENENATNYEMRMKVWEALKKVPNHAGEIIK